MNNFHSGGEACSVTNQGVNNTSYWGNQKRYRKNVVEQNVKNGKYKLIYYVHGQVWE